jgi:hypothetical protein
MLAENGRDNLKCDEVKRDQHYDTKTTGGCNTGNRANASHLYSVGGKFEPRQCHRLH